MPIHSILFQIQNALKKIGIHHIAPNQHYLKKESRRIQRLFLLQKNESVIAELDIIPFNPPIRVKITRGAQHH